MLITDNNGNINRVPYYRLVLKDKPTTIKIEAYLTKKV